MFPKILSLMLLLFCKQSFAQKHLDISVGTSLETNYTGYNISLNSTFVYSKNSIGLGVNYNLSDGFINNPVIGFEFDYKYKIVDNKKWSSWVGGDYFHQKPINNLNIDALFYTFTQKLNLLNNFFLVNHLGYGVAIESTKLSGRKVTSNSITGLFNVGCEYQF